MCQLRGHSHLPQHSHSGYSVVVAVGNTREIKSRPLEGKPQLKAHNNPQKKIDIPNNRWRKKNSTQKTPQMNHLPPAPDSKSVQDPTQRPPPPPDTPSGNTPTPSNHPTQQLEPSPSTSSRHPCQHRADPSPTNLNRQDKSERAKFWSLLTSL